jgi:hypothetical protein
MKPFCADNEGGVRRLAGIDGEIPAKFHTVQADHVGLRDKRYQQHRCYKLVSLIHFNRKLDFFFVLAAACYPGTASAMSTAKCRTGCSSALPTISRLPGCGPLQTPLRYRGAEPAVQVLWGPQPHALLSFLDGG